MTTRVESADLKALANDLQRVPRRVDKEMTRAHAEVSHEVAQAAAQNVRGLVDAGGRGAAGITAKSSQNRATIVLEGGNEFVRAAVFGTELHWVFGNPIPASEMARRVWQPWIGSNWTPEEGLYGVSPAIRGSMDKVLDTYSERMMAALAQAFPEGSNG